MSINDLWFYSNVMADLCVVSEMLKNDPNYSKEDAINALNEVIKQVHMQASGREVEVR